MVTAQTGESFRIRYFIGDEEYSQVMASIDFPKLEKLIEKILISECPKYRKSYNSRP